MNNKKLIRLTESDLHKIVKESVNRVLNEIDKDQYKMAQRKHPNLMNKVDPRTFANRARGVNAQGRPRNDNQRLMQSAAEDAWNKKYCYANDAGSRMMNNKNQIADTRNFDDENGNHIVQRSDYDPEMNGTTSYGSTTSKNGETEEYGIPSHIRGDKLDSEPYEVARQMVKGNGKYNPNKGWQ